MKRILVILLGMILVVSAFSALADRQLTVNNIDTGESFEMTVPDGFRMYQINQEWLDSIPYLMERAREGEPWAYRAIADCYRFGKGGLPVSIFNAMGYYEMSGRMADGWIETIRKENNEDPMAVVKDIIDSFDDKDFDKIRSCNELLKKSNYHDAGKLVDFIDKHRNNESIGADEILKILKDDSKTPDELMFMCMAFSVFKCNEANIQKEDPSVLSIFIEKLPFFYSYTGVDLYGSTVSVVDDDSHEAPDDSIAAIRRKAIEFLLKGDQHACLSKTGAKIIYRYCTEDPNSDWVNLSEKDLNRIKIICQY